MDPTLSNRQLWRDKRESTKTKGVHTVKEIKVVGIDLAKTVFQLHAADERGVTILRKKINRPQLLDFIRNLKPCLIGMEACGGAHHWARKFRSFGHEVKLVSAQFVKPYVKSNKNDQNDAEAICEAVSRPNMRFVPIKEIVHQDIQSIHRMRQQSVVVRTMLINEIRGLLTEYGIVISKGSNQITRALPAVLENQQSLLTPLVCRGFQRLYERLKFIDDEIKFFDKELQNIFQGNETCRRIAAVEGVGPLTATAIVSAATNPQLFKNGRCFSAWLGLVPRQASSGGKTKLLGISKRGDSYIRTLMIHGARSAMIAAKKKTDSKSIWIVEKEKKIGHNKAVVALANKNARVIWVMMAKGEEYKKTA